MTEVILVDENDKQVGFMDKVTAHLGAGSLHRAFAAFVFNSKGELLVTRRSAEKMLWPLFLDNTCSSHPPQHESYEAAGERRLSEELGFTCHLEIADRFQYSDKFDNIGSENELCTTLIGEYDGEIYPVASEIADYRWMSVDDIKTDMSHQPEKYTKWFKIALNRLIENGRIKQED